MTTDLEDESNEAAALRRRRQGRRWALEFVLGLLFVAAILGADKFSETEPSALALAAACVAGAIVVLALWFSLYVSVYRGLDEFERTKELQAVALAGGVAVFLAAAWGLLEAFLRAPDFPMAFLAPVFSAAYAIIRTLISFRYR